MLRDDAYLFDILESARAILTYMRGKDWKSFSTDTLLQDAVVRRLEIIGEASSRVSIATQQKYDAVQLDIIWDIVQQDLPTLISKLEKIVPSL